MKPFTTLNKYIAKKFLTIVLIVFIIFLCLSIILNLFEEINFFKDHNTAPHIPFLMTLLKAPLLLLSLFPFIILISGVYLFLNLIQTYELIPIKTSGISNIKIIVVPGIIAFLIGCFIVLGCTPITSKITQRYYDIRLNFTKNNDYLAAITENGIWIREIINSNNVSIIEAKKLKGNNLIDVSIFKFDLEYNPIVRIRAESANIITKEWKLNNVKVFNQNENTNFIAYDTMLYESTYDEEELTKLYSNLDSISFWELKNLISVYQERGYSTKEIESKIQKSLAFPFYLLSMILLAAVFIFKINFKSRYSGYIILSIVTCIIIYYLNDFSNALGKTDKIPILFSIWMPTLIIYTFSFAGLLGINEK